MKKVILMQLVALFAFSTVAMAQMSLSTGNSQGFTIGGTQTPMPTAATPHCFTDFDTTAPAAPTVRRIQVTGNADGALGYCAFYLKFNAGNLPVTNLKWTINGVPLAGSADRKEVAIPITDTQILICVTYMVGSQVGYDCNTYLIP